MRLTLDIGPIRITSTLSLTSLPTVTHDEPEIVEQRDTQLDAWIADGPQPDLTQHSPVGFGTMADP